MPLIPPQSTPPTTYYTHNYYTPLHDVHMPSSYSAGTSRIMYDSQHGSSSQADGIVHHHEANIEADDRLRQIVTHPGCVYDSHLYQNTRDLVSVICHKPSTSRVSHHRLSLGKSSKHETFTQCGFDVGPPSATLAQHQTNTSDNELPSAFAHPSRTRKSADVRSGRDNRRVISIDSPCVRTAHNQFSSVDAGSGDMRPDPDRKSIISISDSDLDASHTPCSRNSSTRDYTSSHWDADVSEQSNGTESDAACMACPECNGTADASNSSTRGSSHIPSDLSGSDNSVYASSRAVTSEGGCSKAPPSPQLPAVHLEPAVLKSDHTPPVSVHRDQVHYDSTVRGTHTGTVYPDSAGVHTSSVPTHPDSASMRILSPHKCSPSRLYLKHKSRHSPKRHSISSTSAADGLDLSPFVSDCSNSSGQATGKDKPTVKKVSVARHCPLCRGDLPSTFQGLSVSVTDPSYPYRVHSMACSTHAPQGCTGACGACWDSRQSGWRRKAVTSSHHSGRTSQSAPPIARDIFRPRDLYLNQEHLSSHRRSRNHGNHRHRIISPVSSPERHGSHPKSPPSVSSSSRKSPRHSVSKPSSSRHSSSVCSPPSHSLSRQSPSKHHSLSPESPTKHHSPHRQSSSKHSTSRHSSSKHSPPDLLVEHRNTGHNVSKAKINGPATSTSTTQKLVPRHKESGEHKPRTVQNDITSVTVTSHKHKSGPKQKQPFTPSYSTPRHKYNTVTQHRSAKSKHKLPSVISEHISAEHRSARSTKPGTDYTQLKQCVLTLDQGQSNTFVWLSKNFLQVFLWHMFSQTYSELLRIAYEILCRVHLTALFWSFLSIFSLIYLFLNNLKCRIFHLATILNHK